MRVTRHKVWRQYCFKNEEDLVEPALKERGLWAMPSAVR